MVFWFVSMVFIALPANAKEFSLHSDLSNAVSWNYHGKPTPGTHWSPWFPLTAQVGLRFRLGFRFSTGTIAFRDNLRVHFKWDDSQSKGGKTLHLKIKVEPRNADFKTFESAFGVYLPNKLQVGFVGFPGLPNITPWFDISLNFWDIIAFIPKAGQAIATLANSLGVNTSSTKALPLGATKKYRDTKTVDLDFSELISKNVKTKAINRIWGKIPASTRNNVIRVIKLTKKVDNAGAETFAKKVIGKGLDKLAGLGTLRLIGDPIYTLKGERLELDVRYWIPGRISGTLPLEFTSSSQEKSVDIFIPTFVTASDRLYFVIDKVRYGFSLKMKADFKAKFSLLPAVTIYNKEKLVGIGDTEKGFSESDLRLVLPLKPPEGTILDLHTLRGAHSAVVRWASPSMDTMGTARIYRGSTLIATKSETGFSRTHNIVFTGLQPSTYYTIKLECSDQAGSIYPTKTLNVTTRNKTSSNNSEYTDQGDLRMYAIHVSRTPNSLIFDWKTNRSASTEISYSPSQELRDTETWAVKKRNGQVANIYASSVGSQRELTTHHHIEVSGLAPDTRYYYNIVSWTFTDNNPSKNVLIDVVKVGNAKTTPRLKASLDLWVVDYSRGQEHVGNIRVHIKNVSKNTSRVVKTNSRGHVRLYLDRGWNYRFSIESDPVFNDYSMNFNLPANASVSLEPEEMNLTRRPTGGKVYDVSGHPVRQATVRLVGKNRTTTTDSGGHYDFPNVPAGSYRVKISKSGYLDTFVNARGVGRGAFKAPDALMRSSSGGVVIHVKTQDGVPLSGTVVRVKDYSNVIHTLHTDTGGRAEYTHTFPNGVQTFAFRVWVDNNQAQGITGVTRIVRLKAAQVKEIDLVCQKDVNPPSLTNVRAESVFNGFCGRLYYTINKKCKTRLIFQPPGGSVKQGPWTNSYQPPGGHADDICLPQAGSKGRYKMKIEVKGTNGKSALSAWKFVNLSMDHAIQPRILKTGLNSITVKWLKYRTKYDFVNYQVVVRPVSGRQENIMKTITSFNQTQVTVDRLSLMRNYIVTFMIHAKVGNSVKRVFEKRLSARTQGFNIRIKKFVITPNPATVNDRGRVSVSMWIFADANDPHGVWSDLRLYMDKKEIYHKTLSVGPSHKNINLSAKINKFGSGRHIIELLYTTKPGQRVKMIRTFNVLDIPRPQLRIKRRDKNAVMNKKFSISLSSKTKSAKKTGLSQPYGEPVIQYMIDWMDGKTDQKSTKKEVTFVHVYKQARRFTPVARACAGSGRNRICSGETKIPVDVKFVPVKVNMLLSTGKQGPAHIHVQAAGGSYHIVSWKLEFGDGQSITGSGPINRIINHNYPKKGVYKLFFRVTDARGKQYVKSAVNAVSNGHVPGKKGGRRRR